MELGQFERIPALAFAIAILAMLSCGGSRASAAEINEEEAAGPPLRVDGVLGSISVEDCRAMLNSQGVLDRRSDAIRPRDWRRLRRILLRSRLEEPRDLHLLVCLGVFLTSDDEGELGVLWGKTGKRCRAASAALPYLLVGYPSQDTLRTLDQALCNEDDDLLSGAAFNALNAMRSIGLRCGDCRCLESLMSRARAAELAPSHARSVIESAVFAGVLSPSEAMSFFSGRQMTAYWEEGDGLGDRLLATEQLALEAASGIGAAVRELALEEWSEASGFRHCEMWMSTAEQALCSDAANVEESLGGAPADLLRDLRDCCARLRDPLGVCRARDAMSRPE
jgi:hypothetical protein